MRGVMGDRVTSDRTLLCPLVPKTAEMPTIVPKTHHIPLTKRLERHQASSTCGRLGRGGSANLRAAKRRPGFVGSPHEALEFNHHVSVNLRGDGQ